MASHVLPLRHECSAVHALEPAGAMATSPASPFTADSLPSAPETSGASEENEDGNGRGNVSERHASSSESHTMEHARARMMRTRISVPARTGWTPSAHVVFVAASRAQGRVYSVRIPSQCVLRRKVTR